MKIHPLLESIESVEGALFNQLDASFYEVIECFAFQHTVLQQSQVDELADNRVLGGITGQNGFLLRLQLVPLLVQLAELVLLGCGDFLVLLAFVALLQVVAALVGVVHGELDGHDVG